MFNTLELHFHILSLPNTNSVLVNDGKKRPQPLTPGDSFNLGLSYAALRHPANITNLPSSHYPLLPFGTSPDFTGHFSVILWAAVWVEAELLVVPETGLPELRMNHCMTNTHIRVQFITHGPFFATSCTAPASLLWCQRMSAIWGGYPGAGQSWPFIAS